MKDSYHLRKELLKNISESKLQMYRNLSYGAAGFLLIIIIMLVQVWEDSLALNVVLYSASIGLPIWFTSGTMYEFYILLGERSFAHYKSDGVQSVISLLFMIGGISIFISVSAILFYLNYIAGIVMLLITALMYFVYFIFVVHIKEEFLKK